MVVDLSPNIYWEIALPIQCLNLDLSYTENEDPSLPVPQRSQSIISFEQRLGGNFQARTGIGLRF